jgi:hypothetical protein
MYWERLQAVLQKRKCYGFGNVMVWEGKAESKAKKGRKRQSGGGREKERNSFGKNQIEES